MSKRIAAKLRQAQQTLYRDSFSHKRRAAYALFRILTTGRSRGKKAYSKSQINQLVKSQIQQKMRGSDAEIPDVDWGKLFMSVVHNVARKVDASPTQREDFLVDVIADVILGESFGGRRDTGPWKMSLPDYVVEWIEKGKDARDIRRLSGKMIGDKVMNLWKRWISTYGDVGFELGSPDDNYQGSDVFEGIFQMDSLSRSEAGEFMSLINQNKAFEQVMDQIERFLEKRGDEYQYVWKAYLQNPVINKWKKLLPTQIQAEDPKTGKRGKMPLWQALGYDEGSDSNRGKLKYLVEKLQKLLKQKWPEVDDFLRDISNK